ncbi:hypothetical protein NUU61_008113 [Penicillium alfredii]|uniref:Small ribosomal subunit protein mS35 mitochondrial conserved domain-containing protein n=1 Tax=Penicillium alfredii TaxID=1506179 RepID=A0A9W9JZ76_9EURO|nr:uncharacterized protein NUU61_008113 [Penicillium alfredii]KAJ5086806.1 hypothetical protein NUU61_008113 [Penicillium alfredii]
MASAARSLTRSAQFLGRRGPGPLSVRWFSVSRFNSIQEDPEVPPPPPELRPEDFPPMAEYSPDLLTQEQRSMYDMLSPEERAQFDADNRQQVAAFNDPQKRAAAFAELEKKVSEVDRNAPIYTEEKRGIPRGFWAEDEEDELAHASDGPTNKNDDEITSAAHAELELHRELREYARITAWDMPMLSKLAKPFTLPSETHILRFRYTTYMGEQHPAEPKVVVELASQDLTPKHLTEAQRQTFLKLVGLRYNPQTDIVRMSCEKFNSSAQNKRYLADLVNSLIKEAKEGDSFADIPLDLRHHKPKIRQKFPESWNMTEERRQQLAARRAERVSAENAERVLVNGNEVVSNAFQALPEFNPALKAKATDERERVAVKVGGRSGKKSSRR